MSEQAENTTEKEPLLVFAHKRAVGIANRIVPAALLGSHRAQQIWLAHYWTAMGAYGFKPYP